jgi:tetratricopeptide (TPR) repeat protein
MHYLKILSLYFIVIPLFSLLLSSSPSSLHLIEQRQAIAQPAASEPSQQALTFYNEGLNASNSGNYDQAIQFYDRALEIDPNYIDALDGKGYVLDNLARYDEAITYCDKVLAIDPNNIDALINKGVALNGLARYDEAITYYDKALTIDPNDVAALSNKGNSLNNLGRYDQAIEYSNRALDINPNDAYSLNTKGWSLNGLARYDEAITYYDKVLAIDPNNIDALNDKGAALANLARYDQAIEYYDRALSIDPNYSLAANNKNIALNALNNSTNTNTIPKENNDSTSNNNAQCTTEEQLCTYENPYLRIKMQYPSSWLKEENTTDNSVDFSSPLNDAALLIYHFDPQSRPLNEIVDSIIENFRQSLPDFTLIESRPTTIAGNNSAHMLAFSYSYENSVTIQALKFLMIKGNVGYEITYQAEQSKYLNYLPTIQNMIKSMKFSSVSGNGNMPDQGQEQAFSAPLRQG